MRGTVGLQLVGDHHAGKAEHQCTVIDANGTTLLSRRVPNSEAELLELLGDVLGIADGGPVTWSVDLNAGGAGLDP
ncbi:transposase [Streptomyces sp. NBC_01077]|uniref:IS110 family transposase n=1 Tax=Streptomyces sp. NBC_01077 TaxID=2903746 RepID=UPI0038693002